MSKARERLFDIYSQNLKIVIEQGKLPLNYPFPVYICPLCKGIFRREAILSHDGQSVLTVEHVPPQAVGAKKTVLTCKICNNDHGSKLDSHFHRKLQGGKFLSMTPGEKMQAEFKVNGEILTRGRMEISESGNIEIFFDGKRTNPKHEKELIDFVTSDTNKKSVKLTFTTHNRRLAKLSILRSAYLWAFCELGYAFIFSKGAERIRQLIQNYEEKNDVPMVVEHGIGDPLLGINIIVSPEEIRGYLIGLRISEGNFSQNIGVFLPGAYLNESPFFDYIGTIHKEKKFTFQYNQMPPVDFIKDERHVLTPVHMWMP